MPICGEGIVSTKPRP